MLAPNDGLLGIYFLLADIISIFITRSALPNALEIKAVSAKYFDLPGGGMLPGYFFAYSGLFGVVILSIIFTAFFIWLLKRRGIRALPYQVLLAAYAPRILLYDWTSGFRMMFFFLVLHTLLNVVTGASYRAFRMPTSQRDKAM